MVAVVRAWDLAATEINFTNKNPDITAGVLIGRMKNGQYIVIDVKRIAANAANVRAIVRSTAETDKDEYGCKKILIPQDPGQSGKEQAQSYIRNLAGFNVKSKPVSSSKITRAEPFAAQWQQGNVLLLEGKWNDAFLDELEGFPDALHDDQVDAASDAFSAVDYARTNSISRDSFGVKENEVSDYLVEQRLIYKVNDFNGATYQEFVEIYDAEKIRYYDYNSGRFTLTNEIPHYFDDVPIIEFPNNKQHRGVAD